MSKREGIMLCYPFEEKRLLKWKPPYLIQPKLDGERCRAIPIEGRRYILISSEMNSIKSVPHIVEALNKSVFWPEELDGELYVHDLPFEDIFSIVSRTVNIHPDYSQMEYHIFDKVSLDPQAERLAIAPFCVPPIYAVPNFIAHNLEEIMKIYDELIEKGYEGMIVRHIGAVYVRRRSIYMMKFKPKKDDYYKIVGYKEEVSKNGRRKGRLGALICISDRDTFSVGSGLTDDNRTYLWGIRTQLIGKLAHVKYQHITSKKGVPRFPIFIQVLEDEPKEVGLRI